MASTPERPNHPPVPTEVAPDRALGPIGSKVVYEDDRVRVWILKLDPGERSAVHRHEHDYLLVKIAGDRIAVIPEPDTVSEYTDYFEAPVWPGHVDCIPAGGVETAYNPGDERYHEVIVELKQPPA